MKIDNIDIDATLSEIERLLGEDKNISPALVSMINVMLLLVKIIRFMLQSLIMWELER